MFVTAQELDPQLLGLRSLNKPKSAHGDLYMGIHYKNDKLYLVLGTRDKPRGAWASMSVACDDSILSTIDGIDNKIKQLLAYNSEGLFGMKCTPEMIAKYKIYTPLAYNKGESSLALPAAGGKVTTTTIVDD